MWRENAQVSFYLFLFVSEATLIIHRWKMGKTRNRINEPIALSCPSAIVEYHDYHSHSLTHNKITVNNKLVTMEIHTRVTVVQVPMETRTMVTLLRVTMEIISITSSRIHTIKLKLIHSTHLSFPGVIFYTYFIMITCLINFSDNVSCKGTKETHVIRVVSLTTGMFQYNLSQLQWNPFTVRMDNPRWGALSLLATFK